MNRRRNCATADGEHFRYEFILSPCNGFLQNSEPLMKDCELKLRFERAQWNVDKINSGPIMYEYQESEAIIKTLPQNETEIRLDGVKGGNLPTYLFAGIIPQSSLNGDTEHSSTAFKSYGVKEFNITVNGNSVNGFPITINKENPVLPLHKFFDTTNRLQYIYTGENLTLSDFNTNWIWSHKFECENSNQGWLGINIKLNSAFTEPMTLVIWLINPTALSIDRFRQIERINL